MKRAALLGMLVASLAGTAAASDALALAPADSEFVAWLDVDALSKTALFQDIWSGIVDETGKQQVEALKTLTGVDFVNDIDRVMVAARADEEESVVIAVQGNIQPEKLLSFVKLNPSYKAAMIGGTETHQWQEPGEPMKNVSILADGTILFSQNADRHAAALLGAGKDSAPIRRSAASLPPAPEGVAGWLWVDPSEAGECDLERAANMMRVDSGFLTLRTMEDAVESSTRLVLHDAEELPDWTDFVEGVVAFARLQTEEPILKDIAKRAVVRKDEATKSVTLTASMPNRQLVELARAARQ